MKPIRPQRPQRPGGACNYLQPRLQQPLHPPTAAPTPAARAIWHPVGPGDVPSPLAGRVTAVVVTVGQEVKEGDHLVTLEAMKMNTFVFAPKSGKVAEIQTTVGAAVGRRAMLVRIA
jgi:glutaconyl-CoA/methylmalonyl-CoA decarboxylase subunit gamma